MEQGGHRLRRDVASSAIELAGLGKRYGEVRAVGPIDLAVVPGEFLSLLGPSGCGKTTTLRMIAGFETPTSGTVRIGGRDVTGVPVERRGIAMVFQSYALFPHLTVFENVAFGLRLRKVPAADIAARVRKALALVGLPDLEARLPRQMSGGQQQRVALARAIVVEPSVLLMDEPLSSLDLKLREQMRDEIRLLQRRMGITAIYVTHDQGEAMAMSDRIAVMRDGRIEQIGAPREIYAAPRTLAVARFVGQCNVLGGSLERLPGDVVWFRTTSGLALRMPPAQAEAGERVVLAIRPEAVVVGASTDAPNGFPARVADCVYLGDHAVITLTLGAGEQVTAAMPLGRHAQPLAPGISVRVALPPNECMLVADDA